MEALQYIKDNITSEDIKRILEDNGSRHVVFDGSEVRGTCPIHNGDNPTAFAYTVKNHLWYCHTGGCGGGDIFELVMKLYGMTFRDAVRKTAALCNIGIDGLEIGERNASSSLREIRSFVSYMNQKKGGQNQPYQLNRLGSFDSIADYRGFTQDMIEKFGLVYSEDYNRVTVPLHDEKGQLVGVSMRKVDPDEKVKWLHKPKDLETSSLLYNLNNLVTEPTDDVYVTEGAFDVINMCQIGVENVVATFGAHLTVKQEELILKHFVTVVLAYDNDTAGRLATVKAIDRLKNKVNLYVLDLGDYKDLGEIPTKEEFDKLRKYRYYDFQT